MTPQPNQLWSLGGQLFEYLEERESIAARLASQEKLIASFGEFAKTEYYEDLANIKDELDAVNDGIAAFVQNKLQEVDELRTPLIALEQAVALNKADALAATNRAMVLQNRYDKLKDLIKLAMETLAANGFWKPKQSRKFESARGFFRLQGNGGVQPVEITDEAMVPDEYCRVTVTMPLVQWQTVLKRAGLDGLIAASAGTRVMREVSKSAVAETLAKPCPKCGHTAHVGASWNNSAATPCEECGGSGKQGVPGAHLLPRGESLVIK